MSRGALGRADLIRCWDRLDPARFRRVADGLGYREEPETKPKAPDPKTAPGSSSPAPALPLPTGEGVRHPFYRLVERRALAPMVEPLPVQLPAPVEAPVAPLGPSPPLVPWPRLWPFLKAALGEQIERHRVDLPRLVAAVARGRVLRRLPRLKGRHWAPQAQLLLDLHPRLYPFWDDFNALKTALPRLRGVAGLEILRLDQGPNGPVQFWEGRQWGEPRPYRLPPAGTPVLIAGDLGCLGSESIQWAWERFGQRLRDNGGLPVALTTCPARWWNPNLAGLYYPVTLDRTAHLPPGPTGPRPWPTQRVDLDQAVLGDRGAQRLLTLLSACIGITPALLRHLRYALPVAEADVGSEAAAWLHPAFVAGDFALLPGDLARIEELRANFRQQESGERRLAWELIRAQQLEVSRAVRMEERVLLAAMEGCTDPEAEAFLDQVAAALEQAREESDQGAERDRFLTAWVNRRGWRMHPDAWNHSPRSEALWLLANLAVVEEGAVLPPGLDIHRALAAMGLPERPARWRLVQCGERFEIDSGTVEGDFICGSPLVEFSSRRPMMQVQELRPGAATVSRPLALGVGLPVKETGYRLRTDSDELVIEPITCPAWAHTLGRDGEGLFVGFQDGRGERRAYWWNPGLTQWLGEDGQVRAEVDWSQGGFVDAELFRFWRTQGLRVPSWATEFGRDERGLYAIFRVRDVSQRLRWIWPGRFLMGSPEDEHNRDGDERQHEVILSRGFWLAETTCTQALWQAVMGENPSHFKGEQRPVEQVSWEDVKKFLDRLNSALPVLGTRLPSEAEWEYACRAGTTTPFSFGEDISPEQANYDGNYPYRDNKKGPYRQQTVDVGSLPANAWGLYEMHGNVWEWCQDWYGDYPAGPVIDPLGPPTGEGRVLRGGGWILYARNLRSAYRYHSEPGNRNFDNGFRLALGPELKPEGAGNQGAGPDRPRRERPGGSGQRGRSGPARSGGR